MIRDSDLTAHDRHRIHRAQLEDMPMETIVAWLDRQGWVLHPKRTHGHTGERLESVTTTTGGHLLSVRYRDRLPPGYPPLADDDALPFEVP